MRRWSLISSFVGPLLFVQASYGQPARPLCQGPWLYEQHQACESEAHGIRYNSGADPACGYVKDFSVRRAPECGVETYNECRDKSNGVEKYTRVNRIGGGRRDAPNGDISKCEVDIANYAKQSLEYWKHTHPADTDVIESHSVKGGHEKDSLGRVSYHCWFDVGVFKPIYKLGPSPSCGVATYLECPPKSAFLTCELEKFGRAGFILARSAHCPYEKTFALSSGIGPNNLPPLEKAICSTCDELPVRNFAEWRKRLSCLAEREGVMSRARDIGTLDLSRAASSNSVADLAGRDSPILKAMQELVAFGLSKDRGHSLPLLLEFGEELRRTSQGSAIRLWTEVAPPEVIRDLQKKSFGEIESLESQTFMALFKTDRSRFVPSQEQRLQILNKLSTLSLDDNQRFRLAEMWLGAELGEIVPLVDRQLQLRYRILTVRRSQNPAEIDKSIRAVGLLAPSVSADFLANFTAKGSGDRAGVIDLLDSVAARMDVAIQARLQDTDRTVESQPFGNDAYRAALRAKLSIVRLSSTGFNSGLSQAIGAIARLAVKGELIRSCEDSVRIAQGAASSLESALRFIGKADGSGPNEIQHFEESRNALMTIEDPQTRLAVAQALLNVTKSVSETDQSFQDALDKAVAAYQSLLSSFSAEVNAGAQLLNMEPN